VEGIAEAVGLSPSWFKARFRREVGMPPAEYFLRRKVERALQLLANPSLTITRIAHRLGFSSSQHFAAVIRRYTGKTPKQCRLAATQPVPRGRFPSRNA
jgi:AraC-like DNA-binding protein